MDVFEQAMKLMVLSLDGLGPLSVANKCQRYLQDIALEYLAATKVKVICWNGCSGQLSAQSFAHLVPIYYYDGKKLLNVGTYKANGLHDLSLNAKGPIMKKAGKAKKFTYYLFTIGGGVFKIKGNCLLNSRRLSIKHMS